MHVHDTASECWRPVPYPPYDAYYMVSCLGQVKRIRVSQRWKYRRLGILRPGIAKKDGYARVSLCFGGSHRTVTVHKMMALAFLGPPPFPKAVARHLDDVASHNVVDNLAWGSYKDNTADRIRNGRTVSSPGERHWKARITDDIVRDIRSRHASGESHTTIVTRLGLSMNTVSKVLCGRSWKHVV